LVALQHALVPTGTRLARMPTGAISGATRGESAA
jgi:hypothetical protein